MSSALLATPAQAAEAEPPPIPDVTRVTTQFSHPITLSDAVGEASRAGLDAVAFQYENAEIIGEFSPGGAQTVDEFLASFAADFGTEPRATGVVTIQATAQLTHRSSTAPLSVTAPEATPAPAVFSAAMLASLPEQQGPASDPTVRAAEPRDWRPNGADVSVTRPGPIGSGISFVQGYFWHSGSTPNMIVPGFGMEFEVNLYNNASANDGRPLCAPGYKEAFMAQNQNWSWRIVSGNGGVPSISTLGAYADYNDLSDPCNRNSMAIGVRYPDRIPVSNGDHGLYVIIDAPAGTQSGSPIQGVVQATSDQACSLSPVPIALTDCMGALAGNWNSSAPRNRITLGAGRNSAAPNYCWISEGKGLPGSFFEKGFC